MKAVIRYCDPHVRYLVEQWVAGYRGVQHGSPADGRTSLLGARAIGKELDRIAPGWDDWCDDTRGGHATVVMEPE